MMVVVAVTVMSVGVRILANAADVMVMAMLRLAHGSGETGQLHPVFAQLAVHIGGAVLGFVGALAKDVEQQRMDVEVLSAHDLGVGVFAAKCLRRAPDSFFQNSGEQEKRQHGNPWEAKPPAALQRFG
jgi:hypothetical protein